MNLQLIHDAIARLVMAPIILALPIFLSAGTLNFWQGWVFVLVVWVASILLTVDLIKHDPELLQRRLRAGPRAEKRPAQRIIMVIILLSFVLLLVIPGLDYRLGWSKLPAWVAILGDCLIAVSYAVFYFVMKANRFAAATIEVAEGQSVISTGPYAFVRHPMYAGAIPMLIGMSLGLSSLWGLMILLPALAALHWRIIDEEKCLKENLDGYIDYCKKVRFRLIPGLY